MKCKKILALVLSFVMLLSVLAACNTDKPVETQPKETQGTNKPAETNAPTETTEDNTITFPLAEPMTITVDVLLANTAYAVKDNVAWNYLQELSGFVFEATEIPSSEAKEKMGLMMNGGEYSEMLFKMSVIDLDKYGEDGILLPLEDMIREYMPNLTAILDERNAWADISATDGHIYSLPLVNFTTPNVNAGKTWFMNQVWLDALNLKMPTTLDELYNVLKAFKEQDPNGNGIADEIPISAINNHACYWALFGFFDTGLQYGDYWHVVDGKLEYAPNTEFFKEFLSFWKKLYDEGLVNNDLFTQTVDQEKGVAASSDVVTIGVQWGSNVPLFKHIDANDAGNWTAIKPVNPNNFALANGISTGGIALTDKCQNPEVILAFFDYLYTEEGGRIVPFGKEGVSYKLNEDGAYEYIKDGYENVTYQVTLTGASNYPGRVPELMNKAANPASAHNKNEWNGAGYGIGQVGVLMPKIALTAEENEEYSVLHTDIRTYVRNYVAEVVTGKQDLEATWADFQKALEGMEVKRMIEIRSTAYERASQ